MTDSMRLAIVGSVTFADVSAFARAEKLINKYIEEHQPAVIISGGAPGIDGMAARIARQCGYIEYSAGRRLVIHWPAHQRWRPDGFQARNQLIAEDCTHLLAIRCRQSKTYGSGWTADRAEKLGKVVWRELL